MNHKMVSWSRNELGRQTKRESTSHPKDENLISEIIFLDGCRVSEPIVMEMLQGRRE